MADDDDECHTTATTKANTTANTHASEDLMSSDHGVKSNLSGLFNEAADDREEEVH